MARFFKWSGIGTVGLLALLIVSVLGWTFLTSPATPPSSIELSADPQGRPNILLLVAEDMSPRVGAFGDTLARTPRLDGLATEGVRYPNTFTTAGVCAPSRAALITGRYQFNINAQHMRTSNLGYRAVPPEDAKAFPELLRKAGYYTFTDEKIDYQFSAGPQAGTGPFTIWDDEGFGTHWRNRPDGHPFFGLINFQVTHESGVFSRIGTWPHSLVHLGAQLIHRRQFGPREPVTDPAEVTLPPYYPDLPEVRQDLAQHYDNIAHMDGQVGALLDQLAEDGLLENTIVIWTTDHGDGLPRAKRELFDSGIHVPMIIYWPEHYRPEDAQPGGVENRMVSFVDLAPTILALAGLDAPESLHGVDFVNGPVRMIAFAGRDRIDEQEDYQRAVRFASGYKLIESYRPDVPGGHKLAFRDNQRGMRAMRQAYEAGDLNAAQARWFEPAGVTQLYDLHNDPHEMNNLADDRRQGGLLLELKHTLRGLYWGVADTSQQPEQELIALALDENGKPFKTGKPMISVNDGYIELSAPNNASIGYRWDGGHWHVYARPIERKRALLEVKAVRYGWDESEIVEWDGYER